jgi:CDP-paratose 2-epimerase
VNDNGKGNGKGNAKGNGKGRAHRYTLITGGAGFIGTNLTCRLLGEGQQVVVLDNFSRAGAEDNASWLSSLPEARALEVVRGDVRDAHLVDRLVGGAERVFHFAAQVTVTTSVVKPLEDFEVNARGTLNVLEAIRRSAARPWLLFTSTNKVYGALPSIALEQLGTRYQPTASAVARSGIGEDQNLDFHSPYGCSKGVADQYVLDYARSYGLETVVFRMSCIYGTHQRGTEDQGWIAHLLRRVLARQPITIYGDGRQVRDILFIDDLIDAMQAAAEHGDTMVGKAFNVGGGPGNTISLLEALERIAALTGERPKLRFDTVRTGDQKYYVSDTTRFREATGWRPRVDVDQGLERLHVWLASLAAQPEGALFSADDRAGVTSVDPRHAGGLAGASGLGD